MTKYFVSYKVDGLFGDCVYETKKKITTHKDIEELKNYLKSGFGCDWVTIIFFKELYDE